MDDKLMYIPNDDTQYYPFYRLQLVVEFLQHNSIKVPKVDKLTDKKMLI